MFEKHHDRLIKIVSRNIMAYSKLLQQDVGETFIPPTEEEIRKEYHNNVIFKKIVYNTVNNIMNEYQKQIYELLEVLEEVLRKLPNEKIDYSGVGRCAGCGVTLWVSGDDSPPDLCKVDCVLQKAKQAINKIKE